MEFQQRTANCGELRPNDVGRHVIVNGWVHVRRDMGGVLFLDMRDRNGITQCVVEYDETPELSDKLKDVRSEYVLWLQGTVRQRENPNPNIPTGLIEILVTDAGVINAAELPPFEIASKLTEAGEELRLKYRYLDLRRPVLQNNFRIRNAAYQVTHRFFDQHHFTEVETPVLTKSTPEGARDYLVPSRVHKGKFYALPQSPQIYKQLLMVSGFDRYMQIVKCFRDEDFRADRQPEFTQVDVEMSFVSQADIMALAEAYISDLWKTILGVEMQAPFKQITYREAITRYGSDKPDLRYEMDIHTVSDIVVKCEFSVFTNAIESNGVVACINAKECATFSRKQIDELTDVVKIYGAKGLAWVKCTDAGVDGPIAKFLCEEEVAGLKERCSAITGDLLLFVADKHSITYASLGALRIELAKRTGILQKVEKEFSYLWVIDFPMLEFDEAEQRWFAAHHPFTAPQLEDVPLLKTGPGAVRAQAYDLVINGYEAGGGSIRIHDSAMQQLVFDTLGLSEEESRTKFGFLLDALTYGAPPHGGIAFGFDRLCMLLCHTENIRDVISFPKTTSAASLMDGCPSDVSVAQLNELGIQLRSQ